VPAAIAIIVIAVALASSLLAWQLFRAATEMAETASGLLVESGVPADQTTAAEDAIDASARRGHVGMFLALALAALILLAAGLLVGWLAGRHLSAALRNITRDAAAAPTECAGRCIGGFSVIIDNLRNEWQAMQVTRKFMAQVLERIQDGVVVCDSAGRILEVNEAAARLLQRRPDQLKGEDLHAVAEPAVFDAQGSLLPTGNTRLRTPEGEAPAVSFTSSPLVEPDGTMRWVMVLRNLTDEQRAQRRIRYLARYDTLTRVPNRMEFQHRLQQGIARTHRAGTRAALLYVDLDGFKDINDRLGHPIGDRALEITSRRIVDTMDPNTLVGRLGGDEFAILVEGLPADGDPRPAVAATARLLLDRLAREFHVEGNEVFVTASIGIAMYPDDADNVIDMIRNGDAAMYHAKQNGGNTYGFYAPEMNADAVERLLLKSELRSAIARAEFQLLYQPKVDLRNGRIAGCEALLRWRHTKRGDIPPAVFIPLAEENTLIFAIGEWVLERVCEDFSAWQRVVPWPGRVAVNLSLRQLRQRDFIKRVEQIFLHHELTPSCVELEITESTLVDHGEKTLRMLDRLYQLGLHLSIDDFGTGYSSLASLQHFPIGTLKIDQSFIREAGRETNSAAIVGAIVGLGQSLGMDVVAEGVETVEQLEFLRRIGCTYGQGHLFGEPLSREQYLASLKSQQEGKPAHAELFGRA
jgi:diguanylate cyclase (GGDEF)-like protein